MREIKFRAWHKEYRTMLQVGDKFGTTHPLDCCVYLMEGQPVELMQYTGLKDKKGVEIYEGDIVKETFSNKVWLYEVTTHESFGNTLGYVTRYRNFDVDEDHNYTVGDFFIKEGFSHIMGGRWTEVIGNIYENPELLGVK